MPKNRKDKLKKLAQPSQNQHHEDITPLEALFFGLRKKEKGGFDETAYVVLKYFQSDHQCFSDWATDELKAFSSFINLINAQTWQQIFKTGGKKGEKVGLGYTAHKDMSKLPKAKFIERLSEDITFFELRVSKESRVHGFRVKSAFFLVWLDKNHEVYPE